MADLVQVKTLKAHDNAFGEKQHKDPGDSYSAPEDYVLQLEALGLVERSAGKAPASAAEPDPPAE